MRLHILQHVPFEDEGAIGSWANLRRHTLTRTRLFDTDRFPPQKRFDALIVLGGPMNVYDYDRHSWLLHEKTYILDAIRRGTPVLGVCLGAQLIADVMGARIRRNPCREIGWFPVSLLSAGRRSYLFSHSPGGFTACHWHDDTFSIPQGAVRIAKSDACANQAFMIGNMVIGLQFHLEYSARNLKAMIRKAGNKLVEERFVQVAADLLADPSRIQAAQELLFTLLDAWTARWKTSH
jgi:GMP synthase-like glutamine amidotransferase